MTVIWPNDMFNWKSKKNEGYFCQIYFLSMLEKEHKTLSLIAKLSTLAISTDSEEP